MDKGSSNRVPASNVPSPAVATSKERENSSRTQELHFRKCVNSDVTPELQETQQKPKDQSVILTANGTTHATEEARVYVHDLDMFGQVQSLKETPAVLSLRKLCEETVIRIDGIQDSHHTHQEWDNIWIYNKQPHPLGSPRRASNRSPDPWSVWPEADTSCGRQRAKTRRSSSSRISPQLTWKYYRQHFLLPHPPAKPASHRARRKTNLITYFPTASNCEVRRCMKVARAPSGINPDDQTDKIQIAERCGDMVTADHKVLNEEQESRLHHKYAVVVQDLATEWTQKWSK